MTGVINGNMAALRGVFVDVLAVSVSPTGFTSYRIKRKDNESIFGKITEWVPAQNVIVLLDKVEVAENPPKTS